MPWTIADNLGGFANSGGGWMSTVIKFLVSAIAVAVFAIKGLDHVDQGERALKRRFGKVLFDRRGRPKEIGPGLKVLVPFVHSLLKISVRQRVEQLSTQTRKLDDGTGYQEVVAKVIFSVVDVHPGLLVGEDLNGQIVTLCEKHFRHLAAEGIRFTILAPHQVREVPAAGLPGKYTTSAGRSTTPPGFVRAPTATRERRRRARRTRRRERTASPGRCPSRSPWPRAMRCAPRRHSAR